MEAGSEYLRKKRYKLSVKGRYWTAATPATTCCSLFTQHWTFASATEYQ